MKIVCYFALLALAFLALTEAAPRRSPKFTKGNSGSTGRAEGVDTAVDTESKVVAGDGGSLTMAKGDGSASGAKESSVDLESWAGFEGVLEGAAGGGSNAVGADTAAETDSEVEISENTAKASANSGAAARGTGKSAVEHEAFADLESWGSATADGVGRAVGDLSEVESDSAVRSEAGHGTMARSRGKGAAQGVGKSALVDLENFAGIDNGPSGKAKATAIGNKAIGKTGVCTTRGADGSIQVCSESDSAAEASGRGGTRAAAGANDGLSLTVDAASQGRGEADLVASQSGSNAGLSNTHAAGKAHTKTSSRGNRQSFSESVSDVVIDENAQADADKVDNEPDC